MTRVTNGPAERRGSSGALHLLPQEHRREGSSRNLILFTPSANRRKPTSPASKARGGFACQTTTAMGDSQAPIWTGRRSSDCWPTSKPGKSTRSSFTRSTA